MFLMLAASYTVEIGPGEAGAIVTALSLVGAVLRWIGVTLIHRVEEVDKSAAAARDRWEKMSGEQLTTQVMLLEQHKAMREDVRRIQSDLADVLELVPKGK